MGVHIKVEKLDYTEHPTWDWIRHAGDRDFPAFVSLLPAVKHWVDPDDAPHMRPADIATWRAALAAREWPNPGRFEQLLDILEQEPDYWLYFSV
jgi:hypothetical protein